MAVQVKDLKDQIGMKRSKLLLYCLICGNEYSANAGDYFMTDPAYVFMCCGDPMILVTKHTIFKKVKI